MKVDQETMRKEMKKKNQENSSKNMSELEKVANLQKLMISTTRLFTKLKAKNFIKLNQSQKNMKKNQTPKPIQKTKTSKKFNTKSKTSKPKR